MKFDFKQFAGFCKKVYKINIEIVKASKYYDRMWTRANKYLQDLYNKETLSDYRLTGLCAEIDPFDANSSIDSVILTGELKSLVSKNKSIIYLETAIPLSSLTSGAWITKVDEFVKTETLNRELEEKRIYERLQRKFKSNG